MLVYLYCCSVFLFAGGVQGLTGFGAGLVGVPLLVLMIDIKLAVAVSILQGLIITSSMAYDLRRYFDWGKIMPLLLGGIPGVLVGGYVFKHVNPDWLQMFLGVILISYSVFNLLFRPKPLSLFALGLYRGISYRRDFLGYQCGRTTFHHLHHAHRLEEGRDEGYPYRFFSLSEYFCYCGVLFWRALHFESTALFRTDRSLCLFGYAARLPLQPTYQPKSIPPFGVYSLDSHGRDHVAQLLNLSGQGNESILEG